MLNVREHLSSWFGYVWRSRCFHFVSVMSGVLFSCASIIFCEFYFHDSMEPRIIRVIKLSRKLSILQYVILNISMLDVNPITRQQDACDFDSTNIFRTSTYVLEVSHKVFFTWSRTWKVGTFSCTVFLKHWTNMDKFRKVYRLFLIVLNNSKVVYNKQTPLSFQ